MRGTIGLVKGPLMTLNLRFSDKTILSKYVGSEPKYLSQPRDIAKLKNVSYRIEKSLSS